MVCLMGYQISKVGASVGAPEFVAVVVSAPRVSDRKNNALIREMYFIFIILIVLNCDINKIMIIKKMIQFI